jgi:hypothetical protein
VQVSVHDRRRLRLDEVVASASDDEVEGFLIELVIRSRKVHMEMRPQDSQLLVGRACLPEGFGELM